MNKLTVVIVNFNTSDYLARCLHSIGRETQCSNYQVIVVDNASTDLGVGDLKNQFPQVRFFRNRTNVGFSRACNQGLRSSPAEFYLLLNPDTLIIDSAIDRTLDFIQSDTTIGIVGCRVQNPDGSLQLAARRSIPKPSTALHRLLRLSRFLPQSRFAHYHLSHLDETRNHPVEAVSGSFLMFRHSLLEELSGLDEDFFLYGEDLDFCYRAAKHGWRIYYYAGAAVTHFKRSSSSQVTRKATYHFYDAMRIFYRKHYYDQAGILQNMTILGAIRILYRIQRVKQVLLRRQSVGSSD